jgi:hypothetical protein
MSASTTLLALIAYPLLVNLPYNLIRFRWGLSQGLTPMPPEVEERAQTADRAAVLIFDLLLAAIVVAMLRDSSIPPYAVGLTLDNWKRAIALGGLLSFVPGGLVSFLRFYAPSKPRNEPQSRGPLVLWGGLAVLGAFSIELWRAAIIAALIHQDVPAWIAITIASVAYGASQLKKSAGAVAGATFFGGVAGFLFVDTGSLLAPFTMSFITAGVHLYEVRHVSSRTRRGYASFSVTCPMCGSSFDRRTVQGFACPDCGEELTYETETIFTYVWFMLSLYGFPILLYFLGVPFFVLIGAPILLYLAGMIIKMSVFPGQVVQKYGGLRLRDRTGSRKNHPPPDH